MDGLGRIVLPRSLRKEQGIEPKDGLEIFVDGDSVVVQKYIPGCVFCGGHKTVSEFKGKIVCRECALAITERLGAAE